MPSDRSELTNALLALIEKVEVGSAAVDDSISKATETKDASEIAIGRAILAKNFAQRGIGMTRRLTAEAVAGQPPGKLRVGLEMFDFLFGEGDGKG